MRDLDGQIHIVPIPCSLFSSPLENYLFSKEGKQKQNFKKSWEYEKALADSANQSSGIQCASVFVAHWAKI
jgi:hypothetical protein